MAVDQGQGHVAEHVDQRRTVLVTRVREIPVHQALLPGHVHDPAGPSVEKRADRVLGPLPEVHVHREPDGELGNVRRIVGLAVPLGHPDAGGRGEYLDHGHAAVFVAQGHETLVQEVFEQDHVERAPVVPDEFLDGRLDQGLLRVVRPERPGTDRFG